jgi:hypothetical protein
MQIGLGGAANWSANREFANLVRPRGNNPESVWQKAHVAFNLYTHWPLTLYLRAFIEKRLHPPQHTRTRSVGRKRKSERRPMAQCTHRRDAFDAWVKRAAAGANMQLLALPGVQLIRQLCAARDAGHSSRVLKTSIRRAIYTRDAVSAPFASPHISLVTGRELGGNVFNSRRRHFMEYVHAVHAYSLNLNCRWSFCLSFISASQVFCDVFEKTLQLALDLHLYNFSYLYLVLQHLFFTVFN